MQIKELYASLRGSPVFMAKQVVASGGDSGSGTHSSETIRPLTDVVTVAGVPEISGASLSNPYISLPSGEYRVHAVFPFFNCGFMITEMKDGTTTLLKSTTGQSGSSCGYPCVVNGRFSLSSPSTLIHFTHHWDDVFNVSVNNLGAVQLLGNGDPEVYATVTIWKTDETRRITA